MYNVNILDADFRAALKCIREESMKGPLYISPKIVWDETGIESIISITKEYLSVEDLEYPIVHTYDVPYNLTASRISYALDIYNLLSRFVIKNRFWIESYHKNSEEAYPRERILNIIRSRVDYDSNYVYHIDILNYYNSIRHDYLYEMVKQRTGDTSIQFQWQFNKILKFRFLRGGTLATNNKGLVIGNSADDFLAEDFLKHIVNRFEERGISNFSRNDDFGDVLRVSDEFFIFGESLSDIRDKYGIIETVLNEHGLEINRSKSKIIYSNDYKFEPNHMLRMETVKINNIKIDRSDPIQEPYEDIVTLVDTGKQEKRVRYIEKKMDITGEIKVYQSVYEPNLCSYAWSQPSTFKGGIDSYEDALVFIEFMLKDRKEIERYRLLYPENTVLNNVTFSQPSEIRNEFNNLSLEVIKYDNIIKLSKVIHLYPRSQNISWTSIQLLVYIALKVSHRREVNLEFMNELDEVSLGQAMYHASETANMLLLDMLTKNEILEYQKYLILRTLFGDQANNDISIKNIWNEYDEISSDYFIKEYKSLVDTLSSSACFPLRELCVHLQQ